ncbi:MAG: KH domain-containing protein [Desulfurococcaceae archaeon]
MWHILVYSDIPHKYVRPFALHYFTDSRILPEQAFKLFERVLGEHSIDLGYGGEKPRYVGYELLPSLPLTGWVAVAIDGLRGLTYVGDVRGDVGALREHRLSNLFIDIDSKPYSDAEGMLLDAVDGLRDFRVFRTYAGYHIRSPQKFGSFGEQLEERKRRFDDINRIRIDRLYLENGLDFLVNTLFNAKCWIEDGGGIKCYEEKEVDVANISATRTVCMSISLPSLTIITSKGTVEVSGKTLKLVGRFSSKDAERIKTSVEDNFWEYAYAYTQQVDVKKRLADAYGKISSALARVIEKCDVRVESGVAVIHVPESLQQYVGRLIGKQGQNIRAVEAELGMRIRVERTCPPPEDVEMKKKLQELLRRVV